MLQLVGSLENLAGLGPPPGSDYLTGTRGGSPLHRATGRMTFSVHGHVRIKRVRGIVHVGRSMSVSTNCVWHHARMDCVVPNRTCACNTCTDSDTFPAHPTGEHMLAGRLAGWLAGWLGWLAGETPKLSSARFVLISGAMPSMVTRVATCLRTSSPITAMTWHVQYEESIKEIEKPAITWGKFGKRMTYGRPSPFRLRPKRQRSSSRGNTYPYHRTRLENHRRFPSQ